MFEENEEIDIQDEIPWCKKYRRDTRQCIKGCKTNKIKPGGKCLYRYSPESQINECVSYK